MAEKPTIGGHSRRFRLVVLLGILFVLFAAILAVGAVEPPGAGTTGFGQQGDAEPTDSGQSTQTNNSATQNGSTQNEASSPTNQSNSGQNDTSEQNGETDSSEQDGDDSSEDEQNRTTEPSSATSSYGGVSGGGYPEQSVVGGSITLSNRPELRVQSPRPARWRLGGYARYTGSGWQRDTSPEPLRGSIEPETGGTVRPQYGIQVETLRPFRSLATVWRPATANADREVFVTDQDGFVVGTPLEPNETYTTITYGPPSRSEARESTGAAPPAVRDQYTQLPTDTPTRLGGRTDEITRGATTPYEAAEAVERWLEQNKQYSLDATHNRSNDVATEFVFEMDAGYCQYFATAMTAMLRTQDIPARYVTGYTTGERVGEDTYLARGKNAHAWVEVYFDGVGWVSFDPTPGGGRVDAGRSSDPSDSDAEQNRSDSETDDEQDTEDEEDTDRGPPYDITLSPEPVPGSEVTVTVEKNDTAIVGAEVSFNGAVVGRTNETGQLQATVPYASELVVTADPPPSLSSARRGGTGRLSGDTLLAGVPTQTDENSSVRYDIPTDVSITTQRLALPGRTVAANMSLNGSAVEGLNVVVDGEQVDTTNETGAFSLPVPADAALDETLRIEFRRDAFTASGSVRVPAVELTVETGVLKLPGTSADVTVTAVTDEQRVPLRGVTVRTDGTTVATDDSGVATMQLPWSNEATATAVVGEQTVTALVSGILLHLAGVLAVLVGLLAASSAWVYRNPGKLRAVKSRVVSALVTTGEWLRLLGHRVYTLGPTLLRGVRRLGSRVRRYLARLRDEFTLATILSPVTSVIARVAEFLAWLRTVPGLVRGVLSTGRQGTDDGPDSEPPAATESSEDGTAVPAYERLRQCWRWLVRRVVSRSRTTTAVEVENRAVEKGFPRRPVRRLRRAFQDVEYGFTDPDDRVDVAEESVEQLRDEAAEDER